MAYRTDKPLPPIVRLDAATTHRLDGVAAVYMAGGPESRLDANDRTLMISGIVNRTAYSIPLPPDASDTYIVARFSSMRKNDTHVGGYVPNPNGATDPYVPADGVVAGSATAGELRGNAKQLRTRMNAYLNRARSELQAAPGMRSSFPNPGDVEARAYELAKADPEGKF